jgi:hypothetical protein
MIMEESEPVAMITRDQWGGGRDKTMFGRKSLEEKLREGNGASAPATILDRKNAVAVGVTGQSGLGGSRHRLALRVEPAGQAPFEAEVAVADEKFPQWEMAEPGWAVVVLYDPKDHSKVALDVEASKEKVYERFRHQIENEE